MRLVFAVAAEDDLEQIGDYIAKDNPALALSFVRQLREAALELREAPLAFPMVPGHHAHGIRRRPVGRYLIFYRAEPDRIIILQILHGARDIESVLFGRISGVAITTPPAAPNPPDCSDC